MPVFDPQKDYVSDVGFPTISRALAFVVSLPCFILGTATFMLGFSMNRGEVLAIGCILYSVVMAGVLWRVGAGRFDVNRRLLALVLAAGALSAALGLYFNLTSLLWLAGAPMAAEIAKVGRALLGPAMWFLAWACYLLLLRVRRRQA